MGSYNPSRSVQTTLSASFVSGSTGILQNLTVPEYVSASVFYGSAASLKDLPASSTPPSYWESTVSSSLYTTGSVLFRGEQNVSDEPNSPSDIGSDVFFHVSGTNNMGGYIGMTGFETAQNLASFGGDVYMSGAILGTRDAGTSQTLLGLRSSITLIGEGAAGELGRAGDDCGLNISGTIGGKYLGADASLDGVTAVMGDLVTSGSAYYGNMHDFPVDPGADINFFVSGTAGGKRAGDARSVGVFGGDLIVSGTLILYPTDPTDLVTNRGSEIMIGTPRANLDFLQSEGISVAAICHSTGSKPHGLETPGGGFVHKKRVFTVETPLNFSSIDAAKNYSGGILAVTQNDSTAFAITLPTATNAQEGKQLTGWHETVVLQEADAENITIVRGDTSNDVLGGIVVAGDAAASGITIGSNVITFVGGTAVFGDRVDITCISADASNTFYTAQGICSV